MLFIGTPSVTLTLECTHASITSLPFPPAGCDISVSIGQYPPHPPLEWPAAEAPWGISAPSPQPKVWFKRGSRSLGRWFLGRYSRCPSQLCQVTVLPVVVYSVRHLYIL